jgi:hypothetical protein
VILLTITGATVYVAQGPTKSLSGPAAMLIYEKKSQIDEVNRLGTLPKSVNTNSLQY